MTASAAAGIILAAGKGTRMKSDLPKVLHRVADLPMVEHIGRAMRQAGIERIVLVVGYRGDLVQEELGDRYEYVWQQEQLGTGHAALMAREALADHVGPIVIAPGDTPLIEPGVIEALLATHGKSACTVATAVLEDATGYGRLLRDASGKPIRIVEHKDATPEQREVREINTAVYCFDGPTLFKVLPQLTNSNAQREHYLTEAIEILAKGGKKVSAVKFDDPGLLVGVNDRWQLAQAESLMRLRILRSHALNGVTLLDVDSIFIGADVQVEVDTTIEPGTRLLGSTQVGRGCRIGPNTRIVDSTIGEDSKVLMSHVSGAQIGNRVVCGPFANVRPGTVLGDNVKIGNFVEVKNSALEPGVSASHLAYIGDAEVGEGTNIGAGAITCNYDGFKKSRTKVGKNAFVGSNTTLVAPLTIGDDAIVAAGSTITTDVPAGAGAFGRARQETKEGWAIRWREKKQSR